MSLQFIQTFTSTFSLDPNAKLHKNPSGDFGDEMDGWMDGWMDTTSPL
jgi:hypothetical protein